MILFNIICVFHILVWIFVLLAFLNKSTAELNLYYLIPLIYILHILPFHVLVEAKKKMSPEDWEDKDTCIKNLLFIPMKFDKFQKYLDKKCFCSPVNPQGMLIFGAITCAWALKINKINFKIDNIVN